MKAHSAPSLYVAEKTVRRVLLGGGERFGAWLAFSAVRPGGRISSEIKLRGLTPS